MKANNFDISSISTAIINSITLHQAAIDELTKKSEQLSIIDKMLSDSLETIADIAVDVRLNNETITNYIKAKELLGDAWSKANENAMTKAIERKKELEDEKASYEAQKEKFIQSLEALQKEFIPSVVSKALNTNEGYPEILEVKTKLYNEGTSNEFVGFKRAQIGDDFIAVREDKNANLSLKPNKTYKAKVHYSKDGWMAFVDSVEEF